MSLECSVKIGPTWLSLLGPRGPMPADPPPDDADLTEAAPAGSTGEAAPARPRPRQPRGSSRTPARHRYDRAGRPDITWPGDAERWPAAPQGKIDRDRVHAMTWTGSLALTPG